MITGEEKRWMRNCPKCNVNILYKSKYGFTKSIKNNTKCKKCSCSGENNGFYGCSHTKMLKETFSNSRMGLQNPHYGKTHSEEWKLSARERTINKIKNKTNGKFGYNPTACKYLNILNEKNGWNLQHAENGGEVVVCGYLLDGYDKKRNVVVEYDEPLHDKPYRKKKDIQRMNIIINHLNCKFYRYNEKTNSLTQYA